MTNKYGMVDSVAPLWNGTRLAHNQAYNTPPARGAFSNTLKTANVALSNTGRTTALTGAASDLSDQQVSDGQAYAVEFTVNALGAELQVGLIDATNAGTSTALGATPYYSSTGTQSGYQGGSVATIAGTAWSVGDKIAFVQSNYITQFWRNGVQLASFATSFTVSVYRFFSAAAASGPQVTAETIVELMKYADNYNALTPNLLDWPIAAPFVDSPATAIVLTPSPATANTGVITTFTVTANGSLSSSVTVTLASTDSFDTLSTTSVTLTNTTRSTTFTVTPNNAGTKTISTTNTGGLTNASDTFTVVAAPTTLTFDPSAISSGATLSNSNKTITSATGTLKQGGAGGISILRQGDSTVGYGWAAEFTVTLPAGTGGKVGINLGARQVSLDSDFQYNPQIYFHSDGNWAVAGSVNSSTAWATGDKIGIVVYDVNASNVRVAYFRNGTAIGHGQTSGTPVVQFAVLAETSASTSGFTSATVEGTIANMTYGSTYQAYRDSASVQTMTNAIGWPGADVLEQTATTVTLSGPSSGNNGGPQTMTATANGRLPANIVVTLASTVGGDTISGTATLTNTARAGTITFTPSTAATRTLSITNDHGLTNAGNITFVAAATATTVTLTGPTTGSANVNSSNFTVTLNAGVNSSVVVTPHSTNGTDVFTPTTVTLTDGARSGTFVVKRPTAGTSTITVTNGSGLTNSGSISYVAAAVATTVTLTGPTTGKAGINSSNFTVTANGGLPSNVIVTPVSNNSPDIFVPATVTLTDTARSGTFIVSRKTIGTSVITETNNGGLTNSGSISYVVTYTALTSGTAQPISCTGSSNIDQMYSFAMPSGKTSLTISGTATTAQYYLAVKFGSIPSATSSVYDYLIGPIQSGTPGSQVITPVSTGTYYIEAYFTGTGAGSFTATYA